MSLTGPSGVPQDITNDIVDVGEITGTGYDMFLAVVSLTGGQNGDMYSCTSSNIGFSSSSKSLLQGSYILIPLSSKHFMLHKVPSRPVLESLRQTSATSVRLEWSQPSGGATVTGYVVHYSDGDTDRTESVPASSTSSLMTGLTNCISYTFSVEATSEHLPEVSDTSTIDLGEHTMCFYTAKPILHCWTMLM